MHPQAKTPFTLALLAALLLTPGAAHAGKIKPRIQKSSCHQGKPRVLVKTNDGVGAEVHPAAKENFECLFKALEDNKYPMSFIYGYACRPLATSNHPRGLAVDINQHSRDVTSPNIYRWRSATQLARNCNLTHGAVWRNPDAGHFEMRSQSRRQQEQKRREHPASPPKGPTYAAAETEAPSYSPPERKPAARKQRRSRPAREYRPREESSPAPFDWDAFGRNGA